MRASGMYTRTFPPWPNFDETFEGKPAAHHHEKALVDGEWDSEAFASLTQEYELYNVVEDPSEQNNLMALEPEIAARMKAELDAWNASVDRSVEGADYPEGRVLPSGREEPDRTTFLRLARKAGPNRPHCDPALQIVLRVEAPDLQRMGAGLAVEKPHFLSVRQRADAPGHTTRYRRSPLRPPRQSRDCGAPAGRLRRESPHAIPCRSAHGSAVRVLPSLSHATPSGVAELSLALLGVCQWPLPCLLPMSFPNRGSFPPPALPGFLGHTSPSATLTARPAPRGGPVRCVLTTDRASRVATVSIFHACRSQYPGETDRCAHR